MDIDDLTWADEPNLTHAEMSHLTWNDIWTISREGDMADNLRALNEIRKMDEAQLRTVLPYVQEEIRNVVNKNKILTPNNIRLLITLSVTIILSLYQNLKPDKNMEELIRLNQQTVSIMETQIKQREAIISNQDNQNELLSEILVFLNNQDFNCHCKNLEPSEIKEDDECIQEIPTDSTMKREDEIFTTDNEEDLPTKSIRFYDFSSAAGNGIDLLDDDITYIECQTTNMQADFAFRISGDSMEPKYKNGDIVSVKRQESLDNDEIGIFVYNGSSICKKYIEPRAGKIILRSLNNKHQDKIIKETDVLKKVGKVIGKNEIIEESSVQ